MASFRLIDTRPLVDCAMGRVPADLVIRNGRWVSVQTGEIVPNTDIAVIQGRIAYVGPDARYTIGSDTQVVDAHDQYLVPGLIDGHMHVESGMLTVTEFVRAVLPHGTTGMFVDPHEIANVFGAKGVQLMLDEASLQPVHVFVQMPSCVPSAPGFETPGATLDPEEIEAFMQNPAIIGLGEMMNFPGVAANDKKVHAELSATRQENKVIGGHYASPDLGRPFYGYAAGGAQDDHEGTTTQDAILRARQGMKVMMRYGSAWHDVVTQVKAVTEKGMDPRGFILCTDDSHSATLIQEGHIDRALKHAISQGLAPMTAIQMATINPAEHFGVSREMGMIAPGRYADILIVEDLVNFLIRQVFAQGQLVAQDGKALVALPEMTYPDWALNSVHLKRPVLAEDFALKAPIQSGCVTAHVIGVIENQAPTHHLKMEVPVVDGEVKADRNLDLVKLALVERHHQSGRIQVALVKGFGFTEHCAIATTVAHDCHNLIVAGTDDEAMALAVNKLAAWGGGQIVIKDGQVIGKVELPLAGLMSYRPAIQVAEAAATVLKGFKDCGCNLNNPNMQLSLLGLVVIPSLRLSDLGLVDVDQFKFISVLES